MSRRTADLLDHPLDLLAESNEVAPEGRAQDHVVAGQPIIDLDDDIIPAGERSLYGGMPLL